MTQEEYEQEQREIERLVNEINRLIAENNALIAEINSAISDIQVLRSNVATLHRNVEPVMTGVSGEVDEQSEKVHTILTALEELTAQYATFKTLSTASKNLSQYTDEYHTRFSYYNNLRRITLGYVIGLDNNFVTKESMRKAVEKVYLQNTEYWLAYATMAVMLWATDEEEAAKRAVGKAMFINPAKAALFFMLINLRFDRIKPAQQWFVTYMDRVNTGSLGEEFQYLMQAYLGGAFGSDEAFQRVVEENLKTLLEHAEATTVDFSRRFVSRAYSFADAYLHKTSQTFVYLKGSCTDYPLLEKTLSEAEKYAEIAQFYDRLANAQEEEGEDILQRIENVLYSLVNSYDDQELSVVMKIRENEAIISAEGDTTAAQKKMEDEFGSRLRKRTFADLLMDWAFASDNSQTPVSVRKFAVSMMKEQIEKGFTDYAEAVRKQEQTAYTFDIDGCALTAGEDDYERASEQVEKYYESNKLKSIAGDKFSLIFLGMIVLGLLTLVIMAFTGFSGLALTVGILLVLVGVFLLWRRIVDRLAVLKEKKRLSLLKLRHCLEELGQWRQQYHREDEKFADLQKALSVFE